jgi:transcriptional regulator with XRE-family HTH domain
MSVNIRDKIRTLTSIQRKKVAARAAELMAEEMSLRDLRKARKLTQARVAKTLGITQDSVSRLEKRSDLLLSTLRKTVRAMGGEVRIVAEFPDRAPVVLSDLTQDNPPRKQMRFLAAGRSGHLDTAERAEELLWGELGPHESSPRPRARARRRIR